MAITNTPKPSTSLTNSSRVSFAETWATITTTWASETRTWLETISLMTNSARQNVEYLATESLDFLMTEDDDYLVTGVGLISNTPKP